MIRTGHGLLETTPRDISVGEQVGTLSGPGLGTPPVPRRAAHSSHRPMRLAADRVATIEHCAVKTNTFGSTSDTWQDDSVEQCQTRTLTLTHVCT